MKNIVRLLILFLVAQVLGLIVANALISANSGIPFKYKGYSIEDFLFMLVGFAFAVIFLLLIIKFYKNELLFKLMELVVIASAMFIVFYGIGWYLRFDWIVAGALAVMVAIAKFIESKLRNVTAIISSTGVAVMFGMFLSFTEAIIFLTVMCIYDYVAVFITRHMVTLATEFGKREMSFSIASQDKVIEKVRLVGPTGKVQEKMAERTERLEIGTGDIALPLAFNIIVFKALAPYNLGAAISGFIIMCTFSMLALALVLVYVKKKRLFLPALPPILLGTVLGYMIAVLSGIIWFIEF